MPKLQMLIITILMCVATYMGFAHEGWLAKLFCIFAGFFANWLLSDLLEEKSSSDEFITLS